MKSNIAAKQKALELFHLVYKTSKAYRHFVHSFGIKSADIKGIEDFEKIPIMDKKNYIKKYPLEDRLYNGKTLSDYYMICSSSGTSGEPTFWPRDYETDLLLEKKKEALYEEHFSISKKKTLCVVSFGLGIWTAGMLTAKLSWAAAKNNKFSVVTPGIDKANTLNLIQKLYPFYDQVILIGYPPFIGDVIAYAKEMRFDLKKVNLKILCTSEWFSEDWRDYMISNISKEQDRKSLVGFYACSDTGIIGAETKFSIDLLEKAHKNKKLLQALFQSEVNPSLAAYDPNGKFLEEFDNEILITAQQPMPLIRYNIHDRGGLIDGEKMQQIAQRYKIRMSDEDAKRHYVYVFGRGDSVKITANIYIEDIKYCLEKSSFQKKLAGDFKYGREYLNTHTYRLKIIIYLKKGESLAKQEKERFEKEFYQHLLEANNDFKMIQSGTKIEKFHFEYYEESGDKYKTSKLSYFL